MKDSLRKTPIVILLAMVCCLLWGSAFPCIKIGYQLFDIESSEIASQILFAGSRFALAGMMVIITFSIMNRKFVRPSNSGKIAVLSIFQTVLQYIPFYVGLAHTTGVKASIINGAGVFVTILVACLIFRQEKLTGRKIIGSMLGFIGVALVNLTGNSLDFGLDIFGEGCIMISIISSAFSSAFIKRFSKSADVVMLSGYQFLVGGVAMVMIGCLFGGQLRPQGGSSIILLLYMGFISAAAYTMWSILLKYNRVSKVSACKFMNPVFGVLLSFIFLHENSEMGIQIIVALVFVCMGIYIVSAKDIK